MAALHGGQSLAPGYEPVLQLRHFAAALVLLATGIGIDSLQSRALGHFLRVVSYAAPFSCFLHLLHMPVLSLLQHVGLDGHPIWRLLAAAIL